MDWHIFINDLPQLIITLIGAYFSYFLNRKAKHFLKKSFFLNSQEF